MRESSNEIREGTQSWTETIDADERVRSVAESLREPRSAEWISDQADTEWGRTTSVLETLVKEGRLYRTQLGSTTVYQVDYTTVLSDEIRTIGTENTREELRRELDSISADIKHWQRQFDTESRHALERSIGDEDLTYHERAVRRDVLTSWRETERRVYLIRRALDSYEKLRLGDVDDPRPT